MKRVLLDNCLDQRFGTFLEGFEVVHVLALGWERMGDATLVRVAAGDFDVLVTVDASMPHQVNLKRIDLAVIVLRVPSNRLKDCLPKVPALLAAIPNVAAGTFTFV